MSVSRSGYYKWKARDNSGKLEYRREVVECVKKVHEAHPSHVSALEKSKRTVFLSTLQESYESPFDQRGRGDYFWRYKGINMNKKGAGEESKSYYHYYKHTYIWESDEKDSYSDGLLVVFRK